MKQNAKFCDLENKSVLVTGGGSGIGAALTEAFVMQGSKVAFLQRSDGEEFCNELERRHSSRPCFIRCDLTDVRATRDAIQEASDRHGPVTVLVNNAANDVRHRTEDLTVENWDKNHAVNLRPYFFASQAVVAGMREAGGGSIVNFSSISYMMGNAGYPAYTTANAGITGLTRALAREFGPDGIRVNAIAPGWVLTDKQLKLWATPEALSKHLERQCLKEHLAAEDIACGCLFLASDASRMITSQLIAIDGGAVSTG